MTSMYIRDGALENYGEFVLWNTLRPFKKKEVNL